MKKILNYIVIAIPVIAVILMSLSNSICLISRTVDGSNILSYYSYFSITTFGRGCIFALPSYIITIILILFLMFSLFNNNPLVSTIETIFAILALFLLILNSLISNTFYGWIILSLLIIEIILLVLNKFILIKTNKL